MAQARSGGDEWPIDPEEEKQSFLSSDSTHEQQWLINDRRSRRRHTVHLILLYSSNIIVTVCLLWSVFHQKDPSLAVYSPANPVVSYEKVQFSSGIYDNKTLYEGEPTPEKNKLWEDLYLEVGASRINRHESEQVVSANMSVQTYEFPGTDGDHAVSLEVFHQLHCLNILRRTLWPESFPDRAVYWTDSDGKKITNYGNLNHADHCIDRLRQGIQCASNLAVSRFKRPPGTMAVEEGEDDISTEMRPVNTCRNFERIHKWASERQITEWNGLTA